MSARQLDLLFGASLKDAGQAQALANEPDDWPERVAGLLQHMASTLPRFTCDDLRRHAERAGIGEPHHPNCWGAAFSRAAKTGVIERVGFQKNTLPSAHARMVAVWRRRNGL